MKKQALKAVTMLVSIIALAFMTAVVSNAQSHSQKLRANVPFDFIVGDKTLAAGEYTVGAIGDTSNDGIMVRSTDGRHSAIRLSNSVQASAPTKRAMLTFRRYGSSYFLAQIWTPGSAEGREMAKSKSERAAASELAKNQANNNLAQAEMV
ncbi:MAG TPA: hypothetical protein VEV81_14575, partial [Pyrinomonadaceae bacterium]|nr:hypothetical protein [Pyrinomonadaceae bacterium]